MNDYNQEPMPVTMRQRRWTPPPMNDGLTDAPKIRLDEQRVRNMLRVNPNLRKGRTTCKVKRDLENSTIESLPPQVSPQHTESVHGYGIAELKQTLDFFIRSKVGAFKEAQQALDKRREAIEQESVQLKTATVNNLAQLMALLDEAVVAKHGAQCLSAHQSALEALDSSPQAVLERSLRLK